MNDAKEWKKIDILWKFWNYLDTKNKQSIFWRSSFFILLHAKMVFNSCGDGENGCHAPEPQKSQKALSVS